MNTLFKIDNTGPFCPAFAYFFVKLYGEDVRWKMRVSPIEKSFSAKYKVS